MTIEYQRGDSLLHRLDARTKLLLFAGLTVLAVVILDPLIIAVMFFALYQVGARAVDRALLNRNLRVLIVIFLTFSAFQIFFFTPSDAHFLFYLIPSKHWVPVTVQGLVRGAAVFFRFFIVVLSVHLMLYTTPPVDLVLALTRRERGRRLLATLASTAVLGLILLVIAASGLPPAGASRLALLAAGSLAAGFTLQWIARRGLPPEMGMALSIGFATVGVLSQQAQKIREAQKARGYDVRPRNLVRRMRVLAALLLPIFLATLERSQDIAVAILARAFDYNIAARTYRRELRFHGRDFAVIGLLVLLILGGVVLESRGLGNPTEAWILRMLAEGSA